MTAHPTPKPWRWRLQKTFSSSLDQGHAVIEELNDALERLGWAGRDAFHIHMAIEEAVVNAIEHGNRRDPSKSVNVDFRIADDQVWLQVDDQGAGFDPCSLPDPTDCERIGEPRGRGVHLIRELMSEVHYRRPGNCVVLIKNRTIDLPDVPTVDRDP